MSEKVVLTNRAEWRNKDGKLHRLDGPAVEWADGGKSWFVDGKRHRLDGPAIEHADGSKFWFVDGKYHRLDGPAIEHADGSKEWYVDGERMAKEKFHRHVGIANAALWPAKLGSQFKANGDLYRITDFDSDSDESVVVSWDHNKDTAFTSSGNTTYDLKTVKGFFARGIWKLVKKSESDLVETTEPIQTEDETVTISKKDLDALIRVMKFNHDRNMSGLGVTAIRGAETEDEARRLLGDMIRNQRLLDKLEALK